MCAPATTHTEVRGQPSQLFRRSFQLSVGAGHSGHQALSAHFTHGAIALLLSEPFSNKFRKWQQGIVICAYNLSIERQRQEVCHEFKDSLVYI